MSILYKNIFRLSKKALIYMLRKIWRLIPKFVRYRFVRHTLPKLRQFLENRHIAKPAKYRPTDVNAPLVVAGSFSTASGLGEAARGTYWALKKAGLSPIAVDLSSHIAPLNYSSSIPTRPMPPDEKGTLIMQVNGPETISALRHLGLVRGRKWYTIGYWAWELPDFPTGWDIAFPYLSEIWTISEFSSAALRKHPNAPKVTVFGHAISPPKHIERNRMQFSLPEDAFVFLTMADSMSSFQRKNPFAAIAAHKQAFGNDPARILLVKTHKLENTSMSIRNLNAYIGDAQNIRLLSATLSDKKRWELLQSVDSIVSLHRSEGFGLVIAEAMALGKPVIVTGWSGNMDFTDTENAYLVNMKLIPCEDEYGVYLSTDSHWADVSIDHASQIFKTVVKDARNNGKRIAAAYQTIQERANINSIGQAMSDHLQQIPRR